MIQKKIVILIASAIALCSCNYSKEQNGQNNPGVDDGLLTVHFDPCCEYETNDIADQRVASGSLLKEPTLITPMEGSLNEKVTGWYAEKNYVTKWNFLEDTVSTNMTLYARWADTISINYFLKGSSTPIWTVSNAAKGDPLELHDELCDGYQFFGYFKDEQCTIPFDLDKPLEGTTSVYLYRGDVLTYNASAIKRRFGMFAAGGTGSKEGSISKVETGEDGVSYVDVNFGYSTTADPFMRTTNPQIDISHSQKIGIKFKNFGEAKSLSFYWISKYANGSYSSGISYESEENAIHQKLETGEYNMSEDSPWVTKVIDLSSKTTNGVSGWGNSVTMISLRIQFEYISKNIKDFSNVIRIAEIFGVADDTHVGFKDSEPIKAMLQNDSIEDLEAAKNAQTQNLGVIFPKNEDCISTNTSTYFMKTDGVLLYSPYNNAFNKFVFDLSDQHILASENSYLTFTLKNLSYIKSIDISVVTIKPGTGTNLVNNATVTISERMENKDNFSINLYGKNNMIGEIKSISIEFYVKGVDNAILLEAITLEENRAFQIPGINFDDSHFAGFVGNSNIELSRNAYTKSTTFNVLANSSLSNHLSYTFETTTYKEISLRYYYLTSGINSLKVILTYTNSKVSTYLFNEFEVSGDIQTKTLPLNEEGTLSDVTLEFEGVGQIDIKEIRFSLDKENSADFSDISTFNAMLPDWRKPLSYFEDKEACLYNSPNGYARYYFGYLYKSGRRDSGNICLENKSKIYVIYQNQKPTCGLYINIYALDKRTNAEYVTAISESTPIMDSVRPSLASNMDSMSWKVASLEIPMQYRNENYYVANIGFGISYSEDSTVFIRGVVFR